MKKHMKALQMFKTGAIMKSANASAVSKLVLRACRHGETENEI